MTTDNVLRIKIDKLRRKKENFVNAGRESGDWAGVVDLLAHQYSDKTHFIFELLQNADDAEATAVVFNLYDDRLEFSHNGKRLFDYRDIKSIVAIGKTTKGKKDYTTIGKHGIGFKAVFAYTHRPQIYSGHIAFDIVDGIIPMLLEEMTSGFDSKETRFIFPFDNEEEVLAEHRFRELVPAKSAHLEIYQGLQDLSLRTPLCLKHIDSIQWKINYQTKGNIIKSCEPILDRKAFRIKLTDNSSSESWIVFFRDVVIDADPKDFDEEGNPPCGTVKVAFLEKDDHIVKVDNTELVVFFPTAVKTGLGFIIHGPFKTTKARDNIKGLEPNNRHTDPANNQIIDAAAQLAADSLETLCELGLMNVSSYLALPLRDSDFPEQSFFRPVYDRVREALKTQPLLPAHSGGFIKADEAKLSLRKDFIDLFSTGQLGVLFDKEKLAWLDASITESGTFADLHDYLTELIDDVQVIPVTLASKLTADFLSTQSLDWLIKFILYAEQGDRAFRRVPFIRLEFGEQVTLRQEDENQTAWFAPENGTGLDLIKDFPLVHHKLSENEEVRKFLEKEGIHEIKSVDIVEQCILPKYQELPFDENIPFSEYEKTYRAHLHLIGKAYADADDEIKERLNNNLNEIEWLACIHASGNEPDKVFGKTPESANLYAKPDGELGFTVPEDKTAYFLHPLVSEALGEFKSINDYLNEAIKPIDTLTIVNDFILPKYKTPSRFDEACYRNDLQWICKAFSGGDSVKAKLKQSLNISWLACIHASGKEPEKIIWRKPNSDDLFANSGDEQVFRVPGDMNGYFLHPSVTEEFNKNESAQLYMKSCVKEMDAVAIVEKFILPKYTSQQVSTEFDEAGYRSDLQWIYKAYKSNKNQICNKLKNSAWLACVHASGHIPDQICWKRPNATEEERPKHYLYPTNHQSYYQALSDYEAWNKSSNLFKQTRDQIIWFAELKDVEAYFLHSSVNEELKEIVDSLTNPLDKLR